jgi:nucleotide-binding universal stress UspA family protein
MSSQPMTERFHGVPRHVIVPLSHAADSGRAVPAAKWLARRAHARILLVSATFDPIFAADRRAELETIADVLRRDGLDVVTTARWTHDPGVLILDEARNHPESVICMVTHGPGRLSEFTLGTVTQQVVSGADCPVVLVGPHAEPADLNVKTLVGALDGSPASAAVLPLVAAWASRFNLEIELIEVLDPRDERAMKAGTIPSDILESAELQRHAVQLQARGFQPTWDTLHGHDAADVIVDHLRRQSGGLPVVGTHGRSGLSRLVMGSIAMRIVHRSPVPVVVVR